VRDSVLKQIRMRRASVVGELSAWHDDWNLGPNAVDIDNLPKCWANLHNQPQQSGVSTVDNQEAFRSPDHGAPDLLGPLELIASVFMTSALHSAGNSQDGPGAATVGFALAGLGDKETWK
jgi:hypothetical protein